MKVFKVYADNWHLFTQSAWQWLWSWRNRKSSRVAWLAAIVLATSLITWSIARHRPIEPLQSDGPAKWSQTGWN